MYLIVDLDGLVHLTLLHERLKNVLRGCSYIMYINRGGRGSLSWYQTKAYGVVYKHVLQGREGIKNLS
jgi:hypothetical protein